MNRLDKLKAVLFDCDGVLIDSEPLGARRNVRVFEQMGIPATYEDSLSLVGKDIVDIPPIAAKYGKTITPQDFIDTYTSMIAAGKEHESIYLDPELQLMDGILEFLERLHTAGVKCALVSNSRSPHVLLLLNRFNMVKHFDVIITGDMVEQLKPSPEGYARAMEFMGVDPLDCAVIEDSPTGIKAGKASGAYVFGFIGSELKQDVSSADEPLESYAAFDLV